ncbi:hypothetical protein [Saccharopolyspora spinosa]|uniref:LGFP repeat-containing protein n=1 Tax=Saccharopolyspora spinosa TaxID=60894 RepID=A0A2N3XSJ5_SACSN|nr:hypothetical protein [Saccharopolyspora spinosa]PKW13619.1 LGFP repeat-containing protein [Saccharopolyspora spinosa]
MNVKRLVAAVAATTAVLGLAATAPAVAQPEEPTTATTTTAPEAPATSEKVASDASETAERPTTAEETATSEPATTPTEPTPGTTAAEPTTSAAEPTTAAAAPGDGEIQRRYDSLTPAMRAEAGNPVGAEVVAGDALRWQDFTNARFYWTPDTGVTIVQGQIFQRYLDFGAHEGLGVPVTDELSSVGGTSRYSDFVFRDATGEYPSTIYWSTRTGAHLVVAALRDHYRALGEDRFGYVATDSYPTPDERAAYNHFVTPQGHGASIYGSEFGVASVKGAIRDKWAATGWERGPLGYPISDELDGGDGVGKYNEFSGDGRLLAGIVWSPQTGAHSLQGLIAQRYVELGGPTGILGYPTTDERGTPDGRGRYNHFTGTGGASIYWAPQTGANEVYGGIRARWSQLGWERSYLGYPVTGEHDIPQGRANGFEHGFVEWHRDTGAVVDFPKN